MSKPINFKSMKIYKALHDAKLEIGKVAKNSQNPHFKNTYADLNALIDAVEPILLEKGLVLLQPIKEGRVFTIIADVESGETIESFIDLPIGGTPQAMGSAITYYRRYTLQSLLSLQAVDDDGNKASAPVAPQPEQKKTLTPEQFGRAVDKIIAGDRTLIEKLKVEFALTGQQAIELSEL